jgi:hypothetical protein
VPTVAYSGTTGDRVGYLMTQLQTELEYGILDQLELGLYVTLAPSVGSELVSTPVPLEGNGFKERLKYMLAPIGEWPVDVALYGELTENHREFEMELKLILSRRLGPVRLAANLVGEREYYWSGQAEWVLNPSAGVTVEATRWLHVGAEYWLHWEFPDTRPAVPAFNLQPQQYVGPAIMLALGRLWWTTSAYVRASSFGRALQPGDIFGAVWVRSVVGVGF